MKSILWRGIKSFSYRASDLAYRIFPKKAVLTFYCYLTYILRAVTWRLACRYYGPSMAQRRGDMPEFVLSQIRPEDVVIDVGCAEGNLTRVIAGKAKRVVAVEMDKRYLDMIDRSEERLRNAEFINGDIVDLSFDRIFDAAVLNSRHRAHGKCRYNIEKNIEGRPQDNRRDARPESGLALEHA